MKIRKTQCFTSDIFLAILSNINEVDEKAMQRASNELYFLPLIPAFSFTLGKLGYSRKNPHTPPTNGVVF